MRREHACPAQRSTTSIDVPHARLSLAPRIGAIAVTAAAAASPSRRARRATATHPQAATGSVDVIAIPTEGATFEFAAQGEIAGSDGWQFDLTFVGTVVR
jgi:hypothetical protein